MNCLRWPFQGRAVWRTRGLRLGLRIEICIILSMGSMGVSPTKATPLIVSEKSPVPTLWLDTSVGINLAKSRHGKKLDDIGVKRCLQLRGIVIELVKAGKLMCPMSDQEEEYEARHLDSDVFAEFSRLSLGARMNHRLAIQDAQIYLAMDAFSRCHDEILLPWRIYFYEDPIRAIQREKGRRVLVSVTTPPGSPLVEHRRRAKQDILRHTEELRLELRSKGQSFESQLKLESRSLGDTVARVLKDFHAKLNAGNPDFLDFMGVSGFLEYIRRWTNLGRASAESLRFLSLRLHDVTADSRHQRAVIRRLGHRKSGHHVRRFDGR